jgi:hypothetical protein
MFIVEERPITVAVHPRLIEELKFRKEFIERYTGRKTRGGLTTFSEAAAMELKSIRETGDKTMYEINKIFKQKDLLVKKFTENGVEREFVPFEIFKRLYDLSAVLCRKKDTDVMQLELNKIKGLKKNEILCLWK